MRYLHVVNKLGFANSVELKEELAPFRFNEFIANVRAAGYFMNDLHYVPLDNIAVIFVSEEPQAVMTAPRTGMIQ